MPNILSFIPSVFYQPPRGLVCPKTPVENGISGTSRYLEGAIFFRLSAILSICLVVACGRIPILPTRVISVLGLKSTLENPQIQVYFAGNGLLAGENGWPFRRFCGGGGGLPAPLLAPRALILRTK